MMETIAKQHDDARLLVVFGSTRQNKIPKKQKSGASGLAFLWVTSHLILGNGEGKFIRWPSLMAE